MRPIITTGAEPGRGDLMKEQSLAPAVEELWNTWEIHSMILVSLFLQVFLFLFAGKRMRSNSTLRRLVLWLAYLSADSVATFVLGHLAVRAIEPSDQGLMPFWAPFVLVHLGGQETMTAFSMQDNELWKRHLLNLVTQAAVAGYVVGKASWPDRRLKAALVLVFVSGFFKYAGRTLYLFFARPKFLKSPISWKLYGQGKTSYEDKRKRATEDMGKVLNRLSNGSTERPRFMESFSLTTDIMAGDAPLNTVRSITLAETGELPGMLDEFLCRDDHHNAYEYVGTLLVQCYSRLYTKGYVREGIADSLSKCKEGSSVGSGPVSKPKQISSNMVCTAIFQSIVYGGPTLFPYVAIPIALVLFAAAEKGDPLLHSRRGRVDIMVSYLLLVGAVVLDVSSIVSFIFSRFSSSKELWCQKLNQYNMINSAEVSECLRSIQEKFGCDVYDVALSMPIKEFILDTLLVSGTRKEWNIASTRGQLALHHRKATTSTLRALEESVRTGVDFPRSVLIIWHIATDICFRYSGDKDAATTYSADGLLKKHCYKQMSRELSNYIMYLVFKCGVMLTTYSHVEHDDTLYEIAKKLSLYRRQAGVNPGDHKDPVITKLLLSEETIKMEREESKEQVETSKVEHEGESSKEEERDEIVQLDHEESANDDNNDAAAEDHMKKLCQSAEALYSSPVLPRAREVAQELISIKDEAERWDLIAAVWAEMLYYTAPRCGAAFHAEHLAKGGEFATHVFVLMYLLGPFMPPPGA
ncbi:hypothetical protein SETIT_8G039000v2 [Setaria italica]|uniref:DUF4220 domain-containing protein n=2 Tax=Setaria italica TaxID=4555 RepID=A0A368S3X9_SETIT|nr:uncharacterized protein LOC101766188 [Setaria italica]RCV37135.1 hypothetical protein SETIT_8G039000v2 [Setaria italica]